MNLMAAFNLPPGCLLTDIDYEDLERRAERLAEAEEDRRDRRREDELLETHDRNHHRP